MTTNFFSLEISTVRVLTALCCFVYTMLIDWRDTSVSQALCDCHLVTSSCRGHGGIVWPHVLILSVTRIRCKTLAAISRLNNLSNSEVYRQFVGDA